MDAQDLGPSRVLAKPQEKRITYKKVDRSTINSKLDLRGKNGEESLFLVDKIIGDAMLSETKQIMIVHGKGTGRLRQIIHEYLKENPWWRITDGRYERGWLRGHNREFNIDRNQEIYERIIFGHTATTRVRPEVQKK